MAKVIGWILGVLAIISVGMHFDQGEVFAGIICIIAIGFSMPPILNKTNASNKRTAEAKGKAYSELPQKSANILSVILLVVAGFIGSGNHLKKENTVEERPLNTKVEYKQQEIKEEIKPIDLIYQLKTKVDELEYWFRGSYEQHQIRQFYDVKNNYEKQLDVICNDFERLVQKTGNLNSDYYDESLACKNFKITLVHVMQNLNGGTYSEIPRLREKFEPEYQNLKKQVDEELERLNIKQ